VEYGKEMNDTNTR